MAELVQFKFAGQVAMPEVEATLRLALLACESLHGEDRVQLETEVDCDQAARTCIVDHSTEPGRTLAAIFGGYVRREFGDHAVRISRVSPHRLQAAGGGQ